MATFGLSAKLISYVTAGVVVTSLVIGVGRVHEERDNLSDLINRSGQSIANATASGAASLVAGYDYGNLEILAENVSSQPRVVGVAILNEAGRVMSHAGEPQSGQSHTTFQSPILFEGKRIGTASVDVSTDVLNAAIEALYRRILIEQIIFGCILGGIVFVFTSRGIVSPIRKLTTVMESATASGHPCAIEDLKIGGEDEIGRLVAVFNSLSRSLATYHAKLQDKIDLANQALKQKNIELLARTEDLERALQLLECMATTDSLTKLPNRHQFDETLGRTFDQSERFAEPLTLALLDVDEFKQINDTHGHTAGDEVLRQLGLILQDKTRKSDLAARLGGDEFAIILYHTDEQQAVLFAQQFITAIRQHTFVYEGKPIAVSVSMGLAQRTAWSKSPELLYFASDKALYASKNNGRDRYTCHSQLAE